MVPAGVEVGVARDAEGHVEANVGQRNEVRLHLRAFERAFGQQLCEARAQGRPDLWPRGHDAVPGGLGQERVAGVQESGRLQRRRVEDLGADRHAASRGAPAPGEHAIGKVVERERPLRVIRAEEPGAEKEQGVCPRKGRIAVRDWCQA
jgi:hypothetical protein